MSFFQRQNNTGVGSPHNPNLVVHLWWPIILLETSSGKEFLQVMVLSSWCQATWGTILVMVYTISGILIIRVGPIKHTKNNCAILSPCRHPALPGSQRPHLPPMSLCCLRQQQEAVSTPQGKTPTTINLELYHKHLQGKLTPNYNPTWKATLQFINDSIVPDPASFRSGIQESIPNALRD